MCQCKMDIRNDSFDESAGLWRQTTVGTLVLRAVQRAFRCTLREVYDIQTAGEVGVVWEFVFFVSQSIEQIWMKLGTDGQQAYQILQAK